MPIIPEIGPARKFGGILPLAEALPRHENKRVVFGCRVSEISQIEDGSAERQQIDGRAKIRAAGGTTRAIDGRHRPQSGRLSSGRPDLERIFAHARHLRAICVWYSVPRLIRAEAFDAQTNPWAVPTQQEFEHLREIAGDVVLATIEPPDLPPQTVHRRAVQRGLAVARSEGRQPGPKPTFDTVSPDIIEIVAYLHSFGSSLQVIANTPGIGLSIGQVRSIVNRIEIPA